MATTHLPTQSTVAAGGLFQALRRHPLIGYFVLAFGLTWLYELVVLILLRLPFDPWYLPVFIGPLGAALIMSAVTGGRAGIGQLLRGFVRWRVGVVWYLFVLAGIPLVYLLGAIVVARGLPDVSGNLLLRIAQSYPYAFMFTLFTGGPLFEEPGWRGFALPKLQERYRPLVGSLILGALWGLWHLPMYLMPEFAAVNGGFSLAGVGLYILSGIEFALIFTWVFNQTRGSLLLAILLHTSVNVFQGVVNVLYPSQAGSEVNGLIGFGALALALVFFTRGRLAYRHDDAQVAP